jgi:hypothetical protein
MPATLTAAIAPAFDNGTSQRPSPTLLDPISSTTNADGRVDMRSTPRGIRKSLNGYPISVECWSLAVAEFLNWPARRPCRRGSTPRNCRPDRRTSPSAAAARRRLAASHRSINAGGRLLRNCCPLAISRREPLQKVESPVRGEGGNVYNGRIFLVAASSGKVEGGR